MENNNTKTIDILNNEVSNDKSVLLEDALENGLDNRSSILEKYMEELSNIEKRKCYINYNCANIYYDLDDLENSKLCLEKSLKCAELLENKEIDYLDKIYYKRSLINEKEEKFISAYNDMIKCESIDATNDEYLLRRLNLSNKLINYLKVKSFDSCINNYKIYKLEEYDGFIKCIENSIKGYLEYNERKNTIENTTRLGDRYLDLVNYKYKKYNYHVDIEKRYENLQLALKYYNISIENKYELEYCLKNSAYCYRLLKDNDNEYNCLKQLIDLDSTNPLYNYQMALFNYKMKNYYEAINYINEAINLKPDESSYYILKGRIYECENSLSEAIKCYDDAIKSDVKNYTGYIHKANIYRMKDYYTPSIDCINIAREICGGKYYKYKLVDLYELRGDYNSRLSNLDDAIIDYNKAKNLSEDDKINKILSNKIHDSKFERFRAKCSEFFNS